MTEAEKIDECLGDLATLIEWANTVGDKLQSIQENLGNIKPTDPEPLECWARVDENRKVVSLGFNNPAPGSRYSIRLSEVTPQMLQDEKDAMDWRRLKKLSVAQAQEVIRWNPDRWSEAIDKAMEKAQTEDQP